jgi:Protein of unknown function (DUF2934)
MTKSTMTRREETNSKKAVAAAHGVAASAAATKDAAPKEERIIVVCQTQQQFMDACEEAIRELAYLKWEEAGCPSGDGHDFWLEAEREVIAARTDAMSMRL